MKIIVKTFFGLETVLTEELEELGYHSTEKLNRAVQLNGDWTDVYRLNLYCRCALAVLVEIDQFSIKNQDDLYRKSKQVNWSKWFDADKTFAIRGAVLSTLFRHTQYPFLRLKDALVDHFREKQGKRPNVNLDDPQVVIDLHVRETQVTISLNTSGQPLYHRGYRQATGDAPLNEVLAAGMIRLTKWDKQKMLIDPFCGSGTLAIEAALMATNTPANILRNTYSFYYLTPFRSEVWKNMHAEATDNMNMIKTKSFEIIASDIEQSMTNKAKRNCRQFPFGRFIDIQTCSFQDIIKNEDHAGLLISNPPYGQRLKGDIELLYDQLGSWMKHQLHGFDCWILSASPEGLKHIGLKPNEKIKLFNGNLECSFRKYAIY